MDIQAYIFIENIYSLEIVTCMYLWVHATRIYYSLPLLQNLILTLEPSGRKYVTRRSVDLVGADPHLAKRSRESSHLKIEERENEPSDYVHSSMKSFSI